MTTATSREDLWSRIVPWLKRDRDQGIWAEFYIGKPATEKLDCVERVVFSSGWDAYRAGTAGPTRCSSFSEDLRKVEYERDEVWLYRQQRRCQLVIWRQKDWLQLELMCCPEDLIDETDRPTLFFDHVLELAHGLVPCGFAIVVFAMENAQNDDLSRWREWRDVVPLRVDE